MSQDKSGKPDPVDEIRECVAEVKHRLTELGNQVGELGNQVALNNRATTDLQNTVDVICSALAGLAGLDKIAAGIAEIAEVLAPLRSLSPPTTTAPKLEQAIAD